MRDWTQTFRSKPNILKWNERLSSSLAQCLMVEAGGWTFRCVECHIATGTYPTGYASNWHSHNEYQIEIAVSGAFNFCSTDEKHQRTTIRPAQALLIPWKHAHQFNCVKTGVMIGISLELIPTPESIRRNGWLIDRICKVSNAEIKQRTYELIQAGMLDGDAPLNSRTNASHLFLLLAAILRPLLSGEGVRTGKAFTKSEEVRGREMISWIVHLLEQNLGADISLHQISREAGLSTRQIHRLFLKHVGKSLHDYLLERRLEAARKLIGAKNQKMQIKEIAFSCGFGSLSYFCTAFKKAYGVTPRSLLLPTVALKSGATLKLFPDQAQASASASAAKKQRG